MLLCSRGCGQTPQTGKVSRMSYIRRINKKLDKAFDGKVVAREDKGRLILSGELAVWADVVRAGSMAVRKNRYIGLVNDIRCTGETMAPPRRPVVVDKALDGAGPDVLIIGGGIVGCAAARELSRYELNVLLVEKEHDLAMQTSSRNDGMVHPGVDLRKGTRKFHYNRLGNKMYGDVCSELDVDFDRCGQYLCFEGRFWKPLLYVSLVYWKWLGLDGVRAVNKRKLLKEEPSVSPDVSSALFFPSTGLVCPHNLAIAYAENAVQNGAGVSLDTMVLGMEASDGVIKAVSTNRGTIYPKVVVNAAGVFSEEIAAMAGDRFFSIHPRKGTNIIMDKKHTGAIVNTAISLMQTGSGKTKHSKGGGVMRTVDGNTLVGPDAVETIEKEDYSTARQSVDFTLSRQGRISPGLAQNQIITYFSGIRAPTYEEDFVVRKGNFVSNIVHAAGIQSPGITAAPAIGVDVAKMAAELAAEFAGAGKDARFKPDFDPVRKAPPRTARLGDAARAELIAQNPDYGVIICRCEEISKGEILDALRRCVPCDTVDGVKRRARPGMGRCQGGFCGPLVLDIIAKEKGVAYDRVSKSGDGSEILYEKQATGNECLKKPPAESS